MDIKRNIAIALISGTFAVVLALGGPGPAFAHGGAEVIVTPLQAAPGDTVTITGEGFEPGSEADVTLEGVTGVFPLASFAVAADGTFDGTATVPGLETGSYQLKAAGGDDAVQIDFTVLAAASTPQAPSDSSSKALIYGRSTTDTLVAGVVFALVVLAAVVLLLRSSRSGKSRGAERS